MSTELKAWQKLGLSKRLSPGKKAAAVRKAKQGIKPDGMKPQVWAWSEFNPNGIRRKSTDKTQVRKTKSNRPEGMSPQQWAWSELNPNGIRRNKK